MITRIIKCITGKAKPLTKLRAGDTVFFMTMPSMTLWKDENPVPYGTLGEWLFRSGNSKALNCLTSNTAMIRVMLTTDGKTGFNGIPIRCIGEYFATSRNAIRSLSTRWQGHMPTATETSYSRMSKKKPSMFQTRLMTRHSSMIGDIANRYNLVNFTMVSTNKDDLMKEFRKQLEKLKLMVLGSSQTHETYNERIAAVKKYMHRTLYYIQRL